MEGLFPIAAPFTLSCCLPSGAVRAMGILCSSRKFPRAIINITPRGIINITRQVPTQYDLVDLDQSPSGLGLQLLAQSLSN